MKKTVITNLFIASLFVGAFSISSFAQQNLNAYEVRLQKERAAQKSKTTGPQFDEKKQRDVLKAQGIPEAAIQRIIDQRKEYAERGIQTQQSPFNLTNHKGGQNPTPMAACSDMGGENGWGGWQGTVGTQSNAVNSFPNPLGPPTAPNFSILTSGQDACTPGVAPGSPPIPFPCPVTGFGSASLMLGELQMNGSIAEEAVFPLTVTAADTNFIYAYAMVVEDPGHDTANQPQVGLCIIDQNGNAIPCGCFKYRAIAGSPGFYTSTCNVNSISYYKPWTVVGVNLSNYVGQTLTVIITNLDCGFGGHFAQSYWDFQCPPVAGSSTPFCLGQSTSICGPPSDPGNPYTYTWYVSTHNASNPWALVPGGNQQCVSVIPQIGDTFSVYVQQQSTCNFYLPVVPTPTSIKADFTFTGVCGKMTFQESSTVLPASATNTVVGWSWQFPGGSPATSSTKNPGTISYPPGTYTVTLIATSTAGCKDTITHTFNVGGFPTAAFSPSSPCLGATTTLTDGSLALAGDPIASWSWTMPGGTPATASSTTTSATHNATTSYVTAGTHIVTLIVTSSTGCIDTIDQQVLVYNPPVANFTAPDSGCSPVIADFNDISTSTDGTVSGWLWSFPGGAPVTSSSQNPTGIQYNSPGTYSVSLIVTTTYGCKDTVKLPMIEVFPWPTAAFCVDPAIQPTTDPVFNFCDMWSSDVVQWSWNFGDNDSDLVNTDPIHSYSATATENDFYAYNICLRVVNQHGCYDTTCKVVELIPEFTFYIPNTFTPNQDYMNEFFYGKCRGVKEYNIWVFDRWGNQLWDCHREDKNTNWDSDASIPKQEGLASDCKWDGIVVQGGIDMGGNSRELAQEDVYVWKVKLVDIFNKKHTYVGHVNIVK